MELPALNISHGRNHTAYGLLCLAYRLQVHPQGRTRHRSVPGDGVRIWRLTESSSLWILKATEEFRGEGAGIRAAETPQRSLFLPESSDFS